MIELIAHIFFSVLFIYLSINIAYLLMMAIIGRIGNLKKFAPVAEKKNIAVLIPTYKEDAVIAATVMAAATHNYPGNHFHVFVAADHTADDTLIQLQQPQVTVFPVHFERGSKARSLNYLLNTINADQFDIALILDGDNIIMPGVLETINGAFVAGAKCVQVHRTAKNLQNSLSVLDALSEEINNHLFRKAQRIAGLSSALIGSGMAFEFKKLKEIYNIEGIVDNPACDRVVDFEIMKAGIMVEYIDEVYVLDEKVSAQKVFKNQRRRWLESQIIHLRLFLTDKVTNKGINFWNKLFLNLIPPRVIFLLIFTVLFIVCILQYLTMPGLTGIWPRYWLLLFTLYIATLLISTPGKFYQIDTLKAILRIPTLLFTYVVAIFGIKPKRKEFVHTPKTFTGTDKS